MNFKDWKVKSADGKKATLVHKDGHFMSVSMKSLSRMHQQQLQHLAQGGSVDLDPEKVKQFQAGFSGKPAPAPQPAPKPMYAEGTPDAPVEQLSRPFPQGRPLMAPDQTVDVPAAVGQEQQAIQEQAGIDADKARGAVPIEQGMIGAQQQLYNGPTDPNQLQSQVSMYKELHGHVDDFKQYVEQHDINPQHFQESMGGSKKANMAMGLMLGGMSGGISGHGGNVAMDFLNKQIDRDIDAQKTNISNRKTVLGAYENLYGQGVVAQNLARASMLDIYNHKMQKLASKLGTRQAHANALAFGAKAALEKQQILLDTAGRLGNLQVAGQNPQAGAQQQPTDSQMAPLPEEIMPGEAAPPQISPLLHEGSEDMLRAAKWMPQLKERLPELQHQYTQAQQADKSLAQLGPIYAKLTHETNGAVGRLHRTLSPHAVAAAGAGLGTLINPGVGTAAGAAIGEGVGQLAHMATNTHTNRAYDADRTALLGMISSALKGTNISSSQIGEIVDANAPEVGDEPKDLKKKLQNIEDFIKNHTETSLLDAHGFTLRGEPATMKKKK